MKGPVPMGRVDAALVGLAVALALGITLSSRLLRRLRLLQDASRTLDERDLGTLVTALAFALGPRAGNTRTLV